MVVQALKELAEVLEVLLWARTGNQEIVDVGIAKVQSPQDLVDKSLKSLRRISEAKGHPYKLEETKGYDDSGLCDVSGFNWDLMIRTNEVDF